MSESEAAKWERLFDAVHDALSDEIKRDSFGPREELHGTAARLLAERDRMKAAILATLAENAHIADGDDCTLARLKESIA